MKHESYTKQEDNRIERFDITNQDFAFFICSVLIGIVIGGMSVMIYFSSNTL